MVCCSGAHVFALAALVAAAAAMGSPRLQTANGTFIFVLPVEAAGTPLFLSYADAANNLGPLVPIVTLANLHELQQAVSQQIAAVQQNASLQIAALQAQLAATLSTKVDVGDLSVIDTHVRGVVGDMVAPGSTNPLNTQLNAKVNSSALNGLVLASVNALVTTGPSNALSSQLNAKVNSSSFDSLLLASVNTLVTSGPSNALTAQLNTKVNSSSFDSLVLASVNAIVTTGPSSALATQLSAKVNSSALDGLVQASVTNMVQGTSNALVAALNSKVSLQNLTAIDNEVTSVVTALAVPGKQNALAIQLDSKLNASLACPCVNPVTTLLNNTLSVIQQNYVDVRNPSVLRSYFISLIICAAGPNISNSVPTSCANTSNSNTCFPTCNAGYTLVGGPMTCLAGIWSGVSQCIATCTTAPPYYANGNMSACIGTLAANSCATPCQTGFSSKTAGYVCDSNGAWTGSPPTCCPNPALAASHGYQVFTSSGTFNMPANYGPSCPLNLSVILIGGGGGGGSEWGNGGASGYVASGYFNLSSISPITVTIGAAGLGNTNGNPGGPGGSGTGTSFGSLLSAAGAGAAAHFGCTSSGLVGWSAGGQACSPSGGNGGTGGSASVVCGGSCQNPGAGTAIVVVPKYGTVTPGAGGVGGATSGTDGDGGGGGGGLVINGVGPTAARGTGVAGCNGASRQGGAGGVGYGAGGGGGSSCYGLGGNGNSGAVYVEW
eukprot:m.28300 g.28300  ORF g.28300 m.28300 type:complete len:720 (-) comp4532_c0_seq1:112-2271(-)